MHACIRAGQDVAGPRSRPRAPAMPCRDVPTCDLVVAFPCMQLVWFLPPDTQHRVDCCMHACMHETIGKKGTTPSCQTTTSLAHHPAMQLEGAPCSMLQRMHIHHPCMQWLTLADKGQLGAAVGGAPRAARRAHRRTQAAAIRNHSAGLQCRTRGRGQYSASIISAVASCTAQSVCSL